MEATEQQATEVQGEPDAERPSTSGSGSEDESPSSYKDTHATQEEAPVDETPAEAAEPEAAPVDQGNPAGNNHSQERSSQTPLVRGISQEGGQDQPARGGDSPPHAGAGHEANGLGRR